MDATESRARRAMRIFAANAGVNFNLPGLPSHAKRDPPDRSGPSTTSRPKARLANSAPDEPEDAFTEPAAQEVLLRVKAGYGRPKNSLEAGVRAARAFRRTGRPHVVGCRKRSPMRPLSVRFKSDRVSDSCAER
jgi:hypothetical protein